MGKPDIPTISTFECRSVLDSIQNEFDQLQKEDSSLGKLHQDLSDLIAQRNILSKRKGFNEKYCILCCSAFNLLFKRKLLCSDCRFYVCRSCSSWDYSSKQWLCNACEKQKLFNAASREWISNRIKTNFGNFSAAKALQNFYRNRRISDSENDSGYGAAGDLPLMKLLSSHTLIKDLKMTDLSSHDGDCEEEDEEVGDEEELAEIHYSIETILEGLLGGTLDDALVDQLYPNSTIYVNLFSAYHVKLVEAIQNLSKALQKALHNLPAENGITPTTAHAALKNVISILVEECQEFPPLQTADMTDLESNVSSSFDFVEIFSSYDSLVAAAVINKIVEESQSKYKKYEYTSLEENLKIEQDGDVISNQFENSKSETEVYNNVEPSAAPFDLPIECVHIEEIEEITQEFTDSEDDKLSSISKWSNSLQSIDEVGSQKHPDLDIFIDVDHQNQTPIPFPEFGFDLVDEPEKCDSGIICHPTVVTTWEENWLFRKKKRLPLYSNLKYQLLTYCDEPPCMLIPCPSETAGLDDQEEFSSELSETHSAGSLEFSSDPEETISEIEDADHMKIETVPDDLSKSKKQAFINSSPVAIENDKVWEPQKTLLCHVNESSDKTTSNAKTDDIPVKKVEATEKPIKIILNEDELSSMNQVSAESNFVGTPPRPGTIAEREHKKWLNAVPLKHNPYSAENILKRSNFSNKGISKEPIASFEEFERKLSVSSDTNETALNKVNCGPKSIDSELYKRDYYVNHEHGNLGDLYPLQKSSKYNYSLSDDCFEGLPEEALNSFEEKVYVRSGKVFTLENRIRRLEREIKDPSSDLSRDPTYSSQDLQQVLAANMPSVVSNKVELEKVKKAKPCRKVHSLTARSLSREFRDLAKINQPKPMNRTIPVLSQGEEGEREGLCSPESVQSSFSTNQVDNGHGYTSDESNTSSNSTSKPKARRHISRAILERATYWERRAEQGLLSDASVSEEFPGIDINPE